jgi:hypothetical protein
MPTLAAAMAIASAADSAGVEVSAAGATPVASRPTVRARSPLAVNAARIVPWNTGRPLKRCSSSTHARLPAGFISSATTTRSSAWSAEMP